ncbi:hypothetical protein EI555_003309, partial [Monodon monoceros]
WCTHHEDDPSPEDDENKEKERDNIPVWEEGFLKVFQGTLFELTLAANYLNIKDCCQYDQGGKLMRRFSRPSISKVTLLKKRKPRRKVKAIIIMESVADRPWEIYDCKTSDCDAYPDLMLKRGVHFRHYRLCVDQDTILINLATRKAFAVPSMWKKLITLKEECAQVILHAFVKGAPRNPCHYRWCGDKIPSWEHNAPQWVEK